MADTKSETSSEGDVTSLAHQINTAISSSHTTINRLILDRMPKAVPPQTDNPSTYITGLLHMGAVYVAFESLWQNLLGIHSEIAPIPYSFPFNPDPDQRDATTPAITARLRRVLEESYWPNLLRAARIKADVQTMTGWPTHVYDAQLRAAGTSGRLGKFTLHIRDSVTAKPHLLLAYAYCLYLALLSGGSYIRTELMYLKGDFWRSLPTPVRPQMVECRHDKVKPRRRRSSALENDDDDADHPPAVSARDLPLAFLDFDPPLGENPRQQTRGLKASFKQRFAAAEQLLAAPERSDIIKEASVLFTHLEGVVTQLDKIFGAANAPAGMHIPHQLLAKTHAQRALTSSHPRTGGGGGGGVGLRLRDSIAIAKGRLLRTRRKSSVSSAVTATVPTPAGELSVSGWTGSGGADSSSKPSSVSEGEQEGDLVEYDKDNAHPDHGGEEKHPGQTLAADAVVPADGFRAVRYDPEAATFALSPSNTNHSNWKGDTATSGKQSFDGVNDEIECCPISRGGGAPVMVAAAVQTRAEPNYALYAIISNFVVLVGVVGVFVAYLFVRHGEGRRGGVGVVEL